MPIQQKGGQSFSFLVILGYLVFLTLPIVWLISTSIKNPLEAFAIPPILAVWPKLENFVEVFANRDFMLSLLNSFMVALGTVVCTMVVSLPAAYGLARLRGLLKNSILSWLLLTRAAPGMIYVIPYFLVFGRLGLDDTRIALVVMNLIYTIPLVTWMLLSFFEDIPLSVEESAKVDGASNWQILTKIALPIIRPGIVSSAILAFIFSWNEFLFALVMTKKVARTAPVSIVNFMAYEGTNWNHVAVGGILILLPVLLFSIAIRKYLVRGMTAGAVKG